MSLLRLKHSMIPVAARMLCILSALYLESLAAGQVNYVTVYPDNAVFNVRVGDVVPAARLFSVISASSAQVGWSQTVDGSWLRVTPSSGITPATLSVSVDPTGLAPGVYNGTVTVNADVSGGNPQKAAITLILNPSVPATVSTWKDGRLAALSVSVDDGEASCFTQLTQNGFAGTYFANGYTAPSFYSQYYAAGMELGSHLANHVCSEDTQLVADITANIAALCTPNTPASCSSIISLAWPCGFTETSEEYISNQYFASARGYNFNQLEETSPTDLQNLKSFNSHEHAPYPPADLKTVVDAAIQQGKWANLVFHSACNDDGAIAYSATQNIWVAPIGTVIKYILQRDRAVLANFQESSQQVSFSITRVSIPDKANLKVEAAITTADTVTLQIFLAPGTQVSSVLINGIATPFQIQSAGGGLTVSVNTIVDTSAKTVRILLGGGISATLVSIAVTPPNPSIPVGLTQAFTATGTYSDGSQQNLTNSSSWTSSNPSVAGVSIAGVATGVAAGSTVIQATFGAISGSTGLNVTGSTAALVGYWKFDEGAGSVAADSSGSGHTMTLANGPAWVTGKIGGALSANGVNQYGSVPSIDLSGTNAVTLTLWTNRTYSTASPHVLVEASTNYNNSATGFMLLPDDNLCSGMEVAVHGNAGYSVNCYSQPTSGVWHHLAAVFDKSQAGANQTALYIDGVLQTPTRNLNTSTNTNNFGNNPIYLFSRAGTQYFTGAMVDDLRLYNRALSAAEIQQIAAGAQ